MSPLERAIQEALNSGGENKEANKAYLEFIKANFIIPIQKKLYSESAVVQEEQENTEHGTAVYTSIHKDSSTASAQQLSTTVGFEKKPNNLAAPTNEAPEVLYLEEGEHIFLPVFTTIEYLSSWAEDIRDEINTLYLSGVDLLKGVGDQVTICLNIGTANYKEFNPSEIARMRSIVLKFFKN